MIRMHKLNYKCIYGRWTHPKIPAVSAPWKCPHETAFLPKSMWQGLRNVFTHGSLKFQKHRTTCLCPKSSSAWSTPISHRRCFFQWLKLNKGNVNNIEIDNVVKLFWVLGWPTIFEPRVVLWVVSIKISFMH